MCQDTIYFVDKAMEELGVKSMLHSWPVPETAFEVKEHSSQGQARNDRAKFGQGLIPNSGELRI